MKKPTRTLRARALESDKLAKASGGRGICHGYYECMFCHQTTTTAWTVCSGCARPFERPELMGGRK